LGQEWIWSIHSFLRCIAVNCFEVYYFVICAGVFPQKTPEQSMKIFRYGFDFV